ncbi:MAG: S-layer homology domain-containing protein [Armatimonadota bacterium]
MKLTRCLLTAALASLVTAMPAGATMPTDPTVLVAQLASSVVTQASSTAGDRGSGPNGAGDDYCTGAITVTGVVQRGVEMGCLVLGRYELVGAGLEQYLGQEVTVVGHTDWLVTVCQQGTPLVVCGVYPPGAVCTLTLDSDGGGSVKVDDVLHSLPWSGVIEPGSVVCLEAVPEPGHCFAGWSGDLVGATNPTCVTMDSDKVIVPNFVPCRGTLTLDLVGEGSVTVNGEPVSLSWSGEFGYLEQVTLEALPAAGWSFLEWSGDVSSALNPFTLTVQGDTSVTAVFWVMEPVLTILGAGNGSGMIKVDGEPVALPWSQQYVPGTSLTLEALPNECSLFDGWSGDVQGDEDTIVVSMDAPKNITASFSSVAIFGDVDCGFWAAREIAACVRATIVFGYGDGLYRPEIVIDRGQMAAFLARALAGGDANVPDVPPVVMTPEDVPEDYWAWKYIQYLLGQGIIVGYQDGSYLPSGEVTRGQMAVFVARSIVSPTGEEGLIPYVPPTTPTFTDVPTSYWSYKHIEYCAEQGIIKGYDDGNYRPASYVTRGQMAVYVAKAFGLL